MRNVMLKIVLAFLIMIEILMLPLMFICLGTNILLPGVGLIVAGEFLFILLLLVEVILVSITLILFRRLRRDSDKLV